MAETTDHRRIFSLYEVAGSIHKTLAGRYGSAYWVKAEMNKLNHYGYSGHCYPDLIEKSGGKVIAQFRAVLWKTDYERINAQFLKLLREPLKDGIKILFLANIGYDPVHGISLRILDIDAGFTLGDLEREKQDTIRRLTEEGIYHKNKQLPFPLLPRRVAVISVETSKGYADFLKIIDHNDYGYRFFHFLFPSLLQGEKAVDAMLAQLKRIQKVRRHFDVVVIIRGGGGEVGLSCYNDYRLSRAVALFPLPVLTGIGHATNETVVELVAHANAITPTKIAEQLIAKFNDFAFPVERAGELLAGKAGNLLRDAQITFSAEVKMFRSAAKNLFDTHNNRLGTVARDVSAQSLFLFKNESRVLGYLTEKIRDKSLASLTQQQLVLEAGANSIRLMDPKQVLRRGYSITRLNNIAVRSTKGLKPGDTLTTRLFEGTVISTVGSLKKEDDGTA